MDITLPQYNIDDAYNKIDVSPSPEIFGYA